MVSAYTDRSTAELIAVKATLLAHIGTACDDTAERLAAHLDAIETELGRRRAGTIIARPNEWLDEDGELAEDTTFHCPACDGLVAPTRSFCLRCGTRIRFEA